MFLSVLPLYRHIMKIGISGKITQSNMAIYASIEAVISLGDPKNLFLQSVLNIICCLPYREALNESSKNDSIISLIV